MKQRGQGILEFGLFIFLVAIVVVLAIGVLQACPKPDFQSAGNIVDSAVAGSASNAEPYEADYSRAIAADPDLAAGLAELNDVVSLQVTTGVALPPVTIPTLDEHRLDRHGNVGDGTLGAAVTCFSGYGAVSPRAMLNQTTKRSARICQMDGNFFIWILDEGKNTVTMFKNKAKCIDQVLHYLANRGYILE